MVEGATTRRLDRVLLGAVLLLPLAFYLPSVINTFDSPSGDQARALIHTDFAPFWAAARAAQDGLVDRLYDLESFIAVQRSVLGPEAGGHGYLYGPHSIFLIWPLGWLSYGWAFTVWGIIGFGFYAVAACAGGWTWPRVAALVLAPATFVNVMFGQNGFLTAALLVGGLRLIDRAPVAAGVLFGLLSFKPQLGILVPVALIAAGQWRCFAAAAGTTIGLVALSMAAYGIDLWPQYLAFIADYRTALSLHGGGTMISMGPTPAMAVHVLGFGDTAKIIVQTIITLAAIAAVFWVYRRRAAPDLAIAVLLICTMLATPQAFIYDMTSTSVAVILVFQVTKRTGFLPGESAALAMTWLSPILVKGLNPAGWPIGPVILGTTLIYVLVRIRRAAHSATGKSE